MLSGDACYAGMNCRMAVLEKRKISLRRKKSKWAQASLKLRRASRGEAAQPYRCSLSRAWFPD
jgi:hypothetical protein